MKIRDVPEALADTDIAVVAEAINAFLFRFSAGALIFLCAVGFGYGAFWLYIKRKKASL